MSLSGDLPVGQRGLLIIKQRQASQPKHTYAKPRLGHHVLKEELGLSSELLDIKGILHQEEDINIIGTRLPPKAGADVGGSRLQGQTV